MRTATSTARDWQEAAHDSPHARFEALLGLALHVYGVATICVGVTQILLIGRTNDTAPVVIFHRRQAELQRLRIVTSLEIGNRTAVVDLVGAGDRGWRHGGSASTSKQSPGWIHVAMGIGNAGLVLSVWAARRVAGRPPQSPMLHRIVDDLAGRSLLRAIRQLDEIAHFERG
jgi:hypothetical protein